MELGTESKDTERTKIMTHRISLYEHLMDEDFTPQDDSGVYEDWFDHKNVRVIVAGMADEIDEVLIHKFTDDSRLRSDLRLRGALDSAGTPPSGALLIWSASFTGNTPTDVIVGAIRAAVAE